jgi:gamma-glutamyltranspeptidase
VKNCGAVTAPHSLASEAGLEVLREGGTAAEAAVTMAAVLAVVYPHMNSIGGDSFWLLAEPGSTPIGVDACGRTADAADFELFNAAGCSSMPVRGALAATTVAGTVSGWERVLHLSGSRLPLGRLLEPAIGLADTGFPVPQSLHKACFDRRAELESVPGFAGAFLPGGEPLEAGARLRQPTLATTLRQLVAGGLDGAYRGELARELAAGLAAAGSPLTLKDLQAHRATCVAPLSVSVRAGQLFNLPAPTQGFASLLILALYDRLASAHATADSFEHIHGLVEATKRAFLIRNAEIADPERMQLDLQALLDDGRRLEALAAQIDRARASPWPAAPIDGDTVWFGALDRAGRMVSAIQSIYFEFGSGVVLPQTGVLWQNRGTSFRLARDGWNCIQPRRKPFHTLNPAMAHLGDGRRMIYGTMGGDGQPQTQAAVFTRYANFGWDLQQSISAPRWLLGGTWGTSSATLKLEQRFDPRLIEQLRQAGHGVELLKPFTSTMGHAGAVVAWPDGRADAASDPRSDGAALVLSE